MTGWSMNGPMPENSMMAGSRLFTSARDMPSIMPLMIAFSRPVISGWKPAPSSIRAVALPATSTVPVVGRRMPATSLSRVDLPEPLGPITATVSPRATSRSTSASAMNPEPDRCRRHSSPWSSAPLSDCSLPRRVSDG